jgi:uncharacterized protein GlcG (DUF336 family)
MIRAPRRHALAFVGALILGTSSAASADDDVLVSFRVLSPETALEIAQAALARCRDDGYQVSVAVVDRSGIMQVLLRDRYAGPHANQSARQKAETAASFREDTLTLGDRTGADTEHSDIRSIEGVLMLGGGIPISAAGSVVGAVGVAGAPTPEADHACAQAGIDAVAAEIELAE